MVQFSVLSARRQCFTGAAAAVSGCARLPACTNTKEAAVIINSETFSGSGSFSAAYAHVWRKPVWSGAASQQPCMTQRFPLLTQALNKSH